MVKTLRIYLFPLKVLGKCQLREAVEEKENGLDSSGEIPFFIVSNEGCIFSHFPQISNDY